VVAAAAEAPDWLWPAFPVLFAGLWVGVLHAIARVGGWSALAASYARAQRPEGTAFRFCSGNFGLASYGGCLWLVSGVRGLDVSVLFLFRPAHPPLFIPWSDLTAHAVRGWVLQQVELGFARQPAVRLRLARGLAEKLLAAGGHVVRIQETA
jgi:hypothetical protein